MFNSIKLSHPQNGICNPNVDKIHIGTPGKTAKQRLPIITQIPMLLSPFGYPMLETIYAFPRSAPIPTADITNEIIPSLILPTDRPIAFPIP